MIHVGLSTSNLYAKFAGSVILSIFENVFIPPYSITVHILHDNTLTPDNHDKFIYVAGRYNQLVKFYNVEEFCADKIQEIYKFFPKISQSRFTIVTLYRLLAPYVLPPDIEKTIYLDADIIVNMNINELWQVELNDKPIAAADEMRTDSFSHPMNASHNYLVTSGLVDYNDYFNAGVLLMNLNVLRDKEEIVMSGIKFVGEHPQLQYLDQDVLNYLFSKNYLKLDEKFNFFVREARSRREMRPARKIYHFAGAVFGMNINDPFNRLWLKYFMKTPWFNEETIGRLYDGFEQMYNGLKNSMINISATMSGKKRAFFTTPENVEATKGIFSVRDDEEIILIENQKSLQKLIDAMKRSKGKKIFFILYPYFQFNVLTKEGFVYGRDFLNGLEFLSTEHGVPFNSYPLIQAM